MGLVCRRLILVPANFLDELGGVIKYIIAHLIFTQPEQEFWYSLPEEGSQRNQWLLEVLVAKEAIRQYARQKFSLILGPLDIQLFPTDAGKPQLHCPQLEARGLLPELSMSHNRNTFVAAVAESEEQLDLHLQGERTRFLTIEESRNQTP
jgi:phosphopantetheinyl transferase (holo-ACP synthase)